MKRLSIVFAAILCAPCVSAIGAMFHDYLDGPGDAPTTTFVFPTFPFNQTDYDYIIGFKGVDPDDSTKFINPAQATINLGVAGTAPNQTFGQLSGIVNVYNGSTLHLLSGADQAYANSVVLFGSSQLVEDAGHVGVSPGVQAIDTRDTSQVHLKGGLVLGDVAPGGESKIFLEGPATINGKVKEIAQGGLIASSGIIKGSVTLAAQSTAAFSGDVELDGELILDAPLGGSATIDGGTLSDITDFSGQVTINGGLAGNVFASRSNTDLTKTGIVIMNGGTIQGASVNLGGSFALHGGTVLRSIATQNEGSLVALGAATVTGVVTATDKAMVTIDGTQIGDFVSVTGGAVVEMQDGSILGSINANGGQFKLHGGSIGVIQVSGADELSGDGFLMDGGNAILVSIFNSGSAHISNGHITEDINVNDGHLQMENGRVDGLLNVTTSSTASVTGSSFDAVSLFSTANVEMTKGVVSHDVITRNSSHLSFTGTSKTASIIFGNVDSYDTSLIDLGYATVGGQVTQHGQSTINWGRNGGVVVIDQGSDAAASSQSLLASGADNDPKPMEFFLLDQSILQIFGRDFLATLIDGNAEGKYSKYGVTGHFADGEPFPTGLTVFVENGHQTDPLGLPHFEFAFESVPEPSSAALFVCAAMILGCRRVTSR